MLIVNDVHIGVHRKGGTTPASQEAMRSYLHNDFQSLILMSTEDHLVILGDLFDEFEVDPRDWMDTYDTLRMWCETGRRLTLVAGNHDHSPKALRVSSFDMLCKVLMCQFATVEAVRIDNSYKVDPGVYAIAHCSNQDIFDLRLSEVLDMAKMGDRVLLHANYHNNFAAVSDHSLNVSEDQAKAFVAKGVTLYFAHEHQARTALGGSVMIFGNQWPTSIADCLNNDVKCAHVMSFDVTKIPTWAVDGENGYAEIDWRDLLASELLPRFVKVVGTASSTEAADVINTIAKYRGKSDAFVVSNGVHIDGIVACESLPESFEAAKSFDVMSFIKENTTEEEYVVIEKLRSTT